MAGAQPGSAARTAWNWSTAHSLYNLEHTAGGLGCRLPGLEAELEHLPWPGTGDTAQVTPGRNLAQIWPTSWAFRPGTWAWTLGPGPPDQASNMPLCPGTPDIPDHWPGPWAQEPGTLEHVNRNLAWPVLRQLPDNPADLGPGAWNLTNEDKTRHTAYLPGHLGLDMEPQGAWPGLDRPWEP
jgi:hypothetical protein